VPIQLVMQSYLIGFTSPVGVEAVAVGVPLSEGGSVPVPAQSSLIQHDRLFIPLVVAVVVVVVVVVVVEVRGCCCGCCGLSKAPCFFIR
jgi:hypothetical protein